MQSQNFARFGNLQDERLAFRRVDRKLHTAFTEHVNTARRLPFYKQDGSARISRRKLDLLKCFESSSRQCAEEIV